MKRNYLSVVNSLVVAATFLLPWTALNAQASAAIRGTIKGVYQDQGVLVRSTVYFLDANNAVIKARVEGADVFDSGKLPAGSYRIRFEAFADKLSFLPIYYGTNADGTSRGEDVFDLGEVVTLADGEIKTLPTVLLYAVDPIKVVQCSGTIAGVVTDAAQTPLIEIVVSAVNSANAMPLGLTVTTATGYAIDYFGPCVTPKVRFSDPAARYLPEYSGAGGADSFSLGAAIDWRDKKVELNESLAAVSPAQAVQNVAAQVEALGLTADPSLTSGLDSASKLLTDANPNNDKSSCNILDSFVQRVTARLNGGSLSQAQADLLLQSAAAAKASIGCL